MKTMGLSKLQKRDPLLRFRFDDRLGVIEDLRGNLADVGDRGGKGLQSAGLHLLKSNPELFGDVSDSRLTVLQEAPDAQDGLSIILQQHHHRHRVYGGSVRFHRNRNGVLDNVGNRLFPDLADVPAQPRITEEQAVSAAQRATHCKSKPEREPELMVYRFQEKPHLVWEVRLVDTKPGERGAPAHWIAYVDATSGRAIQWFDNVQTAGPVVANGTGVYSGGGPLNAWFNDVTYQLRDTTRTVAGGPEIITNDEDGASPSEDVDSNWNDLTSTPRDHNQGAEVDAHRYAGDVVDYFRTTHGRNSYDGAGANLVILSHFGTNLSNGYWDGTRVKLGDGSGDAATGDNYECSDDWLAHEFTHAYTQHTCALQYLNEAGALNEAFSDIFAAFITGDWLVFEDTWLKASAPAARNMMDPTNGGLWDVTDPSGSVLAGHQPSHYSQRYTGTWDNGGVHINSGIINNLFYLLTVGGTHTVSGTTVTGIGQSAAEQMLFRCMSDILVGQPTATFLNFRAAMLDACLELFPTDLEKLIQVKNAFNAVGIGPDIYVRDNVADTGAEPYPGTYLYASPDIINRTSTLVAPTAELADMTDDSLWQNVAFGQDNFVYIRLQNRGSHNGDTTINVYFSAASTFGTPASWLHIGTLAETAIVPGSVRIAGPLTFPQAMIPAVGHYCMIAVVTDSLDPAPDHSLIASVGDYLNYVRKTNNIAYRNMNVVDLVPAAPGSLEVTIQSMPRLAERFDLQLDVGRFVPGARVQVRGPSRILDGAVPLGMKLVARRRGESIYEILRGEERLRKLEFLGLRKPGAENILGFANVLVEKSFQLKVDYVFPEKGTERAWKRIASRKGYMLGIRQIWKGEVVGAVGLKTAPLMAQKLPGDIMVVPKRHSNRRHRA